MVGSGAAGLMACLNLPLRLRVLLVNKDSGHRSASHWAQGGIAAAMRDDDSSAVHLQDTLRAGDGLCEARAVELLVEEAPRCVEALLTLGVELDRADDGRLSSTLEAAHSRRRVLHAADQTGKAIVDVLSQRVLERPGLERLDNAVVLQLWVEQGRCRGVQLMAMGQIRWVPAAAVVLASGGGCRLFAKTTNPPLASGDGVVMAHRAGARLRDLEFVQFHPTALMVPGGPHFLISEAVRGEGAVLRSLAGDDPLAGLEGGPLAPRDQVSRAIARHMLQAREDHAWLDLTPIGREQVERRFPTILRRCREWRIDPLEQPIPIAPAAHYWMGGVYTDLLARTTIEGLYAVGEVASTGVHGANRLASNSLMECLVFARQLRQLEPLPIAAGPHPTRLEPVRIDPFRLVEGQRLGRRIRTLAWEAAGLERDDRGLAAAARELAAMAALLKRRSELAPLRCQEPGRSWSIAPRDMTLLRRWMEADHLCGLGLLLVQAARFRRESRGGHHRLDHPSRQPAWACHTLQQANPADPADPAGHISTAPLQC